MTLHTGPAAPGSAYGPPPDTTPDGTAPHTTPNGTAQHVALPAYTHVDAQAALHALVHAQGNPAVAAERCGLASADALLAAMALDETVHDQARAVIRFFQLTNLLGAIQHVQDDLLEKLPNMDGKDVAKLYSSLVLAAELMTKTPASPGAAASNNLMDAIMRMAPPEVRGALKVLMPQGPDMGVESEHAA